MEITGHTSWDSHLWTKKYALDMPQNENFKFAISKAYYAFRLNQPVKMIHLYDVFQQDLEICDKSPGLPWRNLVKTKNDIRTDPEAIRKVRHFWHRIKNSEHMRAPDCLAYVRSHICPIGERKIRAVWDYPATITFGEAVFCLPLIRAFKDKGSDIKIKNPFAYGYETEIGGMKKICHRFEGYKHYAGLDFKNFDKSVPTGLIEMAFGILMANIDFIRYDEYGIADASKMIIMWCFMKDYFINTGLRFGKNSGIASGSYFTQLVRSVCNYILCQWMSLEQTGECAKDIIVQGDDSLMATSGPLNLDKCNDLMRTIGMEINFKKSQVTNELMTMKFLGFTIGKTTT